MRSETSKPTSADLYERDANPLLATPTGRLMAGFATMAHGYENKVVFSALLQFTATLIVTQIYSPHLGRMVDKYCDDLTRLVTDREAAIRAAHARSVEPERPKGKAKAKKARAVRRKAASRD
jgi:hypothetical protein